MHKLPGGFDYTDLNTVIYGFCREVDESCALLGYYAAGSGNFLPTFRDNLVPKRP
jgi:hypothetical protein